MSVTIPADDHGRIRIFQVAPPGPEGLLDKTAPALRAALGTDALNPDFVDVFDTASLGEMGLIDYLSQGYDISPDVADRVLLEGLRGLVILVMSRATGGAEVKLTLAPGVTHVTTCGDGARLAVPDRIDSDAAQGVIGDAPGKAPSDAAVSGRIAMIALLVLFALVGVMLWVAA